ncbi:hypothetical protein EGI26_12375 [Lacihabitans sp. CCS-44]|uniref:heavy metal-binding domain-containing protein n=1 Tax=Lacihabitans sp. CCS-44 TaxID=2487331 RepID=UPI0020CCCB32|nr:heavy metal-binding domain-containing protein [Lacihabitans sp. CCS-44]MCP9755950.1 hypothetical protein [Lacihabitans sp. CCS-44]
MKVKSTIVAAIIASVSFVSCNNQTSETKEATATTTDSTAVKASVTHTEYVCEMDCEKGKKYETAGKCPVCKMDLVAKTHEHNEDHEKAKQDSVDKEHGHSHGDEGHSHDKEAK